MILSCTSLALLLPLVLSLEDGCTLQCNPDIDADCVFTKPEDLDRYADHPLTVDGEAFDWHKVKDSDGMHCECPAGWTGLTCETEYKSCADGAHTCYNGGVCVPGLLGPFGNEQLFCNCERAFDKDLNHYVGKYCDQIASDYCDATGMLFCLNGGSCNKNFP